MAQQVAPYKSSAMPFNVLVRDGDHDAVKIRLGVAVAAGVPVVIDHKLGRVPTEAVIVRKDKAIDLYVTEADTQKLVGAFSATDADVIVRIA